jgi:ribonuclease HI
MPFKYYAVKVGRTPGIYTSWSDCQIQIKGYPGAIFKSFFSKEEANLFINPLHQKEEKKEYSRVFYTDGSFQNNLAGSSAIDVTYQKIQYCRLPGELQSNNRAELYGIILALKICSDKQSVIIHTDSQYTINVLQSGYQARDNLDLILIIKNLIKEKSLSVFFAYVQAHSRIVYNELADYYAKKSLMCPSDFIEEIELTQKWVKETE